MDSSGSKKKELRILSDSLLSALNSVENLWVLKTVILLKHVKGGFCHTDYQEIGIIP